MEKTFKRYQGWCECCDRDYVEAGKKCLHCGNKNHPKSKLKKNKYELVKRTAEELAESRCSAYDYLIP